MSFKIEIPDELFAKLQKHAVPLVDTPIDVIERAIRALEASDEDAADAVHPSGLRAFNPAAAPNLTFTTLKRARIAKKVLPKSQTYWNSVLHAVILEAAEMGQSAQDIFDLISVNCKLGKREDNNFTYLESAGISIQGQAANSAWKQAYVIASSFGIELDVAFSWQDNEKAAMPNVAGPMLFDGK